MKFNDNGNHYVNGEKNVVNHNFPTMFSTHSRTNVFIWSRFSLLSENTFKLDPSNILFPVNSLPYNLLTTLGKKPFETIEEKGENAANHHFLLFPQCFLTFL